MIIIKHIKIMQMQYLDIWSMLLSGQVLHRLIEALQVTCFAISRRPCAKHCPIGWKQLTSCYWLIFSINWFQWKIIIMLHLNVAQQFLSLNGHAPVSYLSYQRQWFWAEQTIFIENFSKQNIWRLTQVKNVGREAWHTTFATYISKWSKGTVWL